MKNQNFNWPPLESDPQIFTEYAHKIGLNANVSFQELYSLDYKEMQLIEGPVHSVIVSYERDLPSELCKDRFRPVNFLPFFIKQTDVLDNACGLIAMLHSIGNNLNTISLSDDSVLSNFYQKSKDMGYEQKAKFLECFDEFKIAHQEFSNQGQSNLCEEQSQVKNHFVAFVYHQGNLVELDGLVQGPYIVKENITESELLDATIEELKKRLDDQNITENLALMYLTKI